MKKFNKILFFGGSDCVHSQMVHQWLSEHTENLEVIFSADRKNRIPDHILNWSGDYIICFRSYFILPQDLIDRAKIAAINFHPGSPEYPGSGSASWALYNNNKEFGVTAHVMHATIDSGPILDVLTFPVLELDNVVSLSQRSRMFLYDLFLRVMNNILLIQDYINIRKLSSQYTWSSLPHKINEINQLQKISPDIDRTELEKIIRATATGKFNPYIELHGYKFRLEI
jgi:methionyl-tRNA formyltransferase